MKLHIKACRRLTKTQCFRNKKDLNSKQRFSFRACHHRNHSKRLRSCFLFIARRTGSAVDGIRTSTLFDIVHVDFKRSRQLMLPRVFSRIGSGPLWHYRVQSSCFGGIKDNRPSHKVAIASLANHAENLGIIVRSNTASLFPFAEFCLPNGQHISEHEVIQALSSLITEDRQERIRRVAAERTFDVVPVIEGIHDNGNVAAVCRSCDALGYGQINVVTNRHRYKSSNRTSRGSEKWLDVVHWKDPLDCVRHLKQQGRKVYATELSPRAVDVHDIDWTEPAAVIFGNEKYGISAEVVAAADASIIVKTTGFAQSLNISVAAALVLFSIQQQRVARTGHHASLSPEETRILTAVMMMRDQIDILPKLGELLDAARQSSTKYAQIGVSHQVT